MTNAKKAKGDLDETDRYVWGEQIVTEAYEELQLETEGYGGG